MVLVQEWPFFQLFVFQQYRIGKCVLRYSRTKKKYFLRHRNKKFKNSKNWDFSKVVNPWFWSKNGHFFQLFIFRQYRPRKCVLRYSRTKTKLSRLNKKEVQKFEKLGVFQRDYPMVLLEKWPFFQLSVFRQYRIGKGVLRYSRTKKRLSTS